MRTICHLRIRPEFAATIKQKVQYKLHTHKPQPLPSSIFTTESLHEAGIKLLFTIKKKTQGDP